MSQSISNGDDAIVGINVTPLVDIVLVLLIIFMVTAKLIAGQGVQLDLPKAATAGAVQSVFNLSIDARGNVLANGNKVHDRAELASQAKRMLSTDPGLRALISAEAAANHGDVLRVMDSLREAGLTKIAFAADPGSPSSEFGDSKP
jgi:biopolymer transport protein ExbD